MEKDDDQLILLPSEFKKHSALIAASCDITLSQRKAFNGFLAIAANQLKNDPTLDRYEVRLSDLAALTGLDCGKSKQRLLRELDKLMSTRAYWNVLGKDRADDYTEGTVLLADFTAQGDTLKFGFSPLIREKILKPRMYAPLKFSTIRAIERKYSAILYELCTDYRNISRLELTMEDLRQVLGLQPDEYNRHALFESKVLAPAVEELNTKSELTIRYRYIKNGRNVTGVVFNIKEEPEKLVFHGESTKAKDQRELISMLPDSLQSNKKLLTIIHKMYIQEGYDYVASNIAFATKKAKTNPGRMVEMALEDDFAHDEREKSAKKASKPVTSNKKKQSVVSTDPEVVEKQKYIEYFNQLNESEQKEILDDIKRHREKGTAASQFIFGTEENKIYGYLLNVRRIAL